MTNAHRLLLPALLLLAGITITQTPKNLVGNGDGDERDGDGSDSVCIGECSAPLQYQPRLNTERE